MSADTASSSVKRRSTGPRGLSIAGQVLLVLGLGMAAMPFVGALIGVPFDGAGTWDVDLNRLALHVLPGVAGVVLGAMLLKAHATRERDGSVPTWLPQVLVGVAVVGLWYAAGPWLLEAVLPASAEGRMFLGVPGFATFSTAHQLTLEAFCHWIPGAICLAVGAGAYLAARRHAAQGARTVTA